MRIGVLAGMRSISSRGYASGGKARPVPDKPTGTIGTPALIARRAAPVKPGSRPVRGSTARRGTSSSPGIVPSGKITTAQPRRSASAIWSRAPSSPPRRMKTDSDSLIRCRSTTQSASSDLAMEVHPPRAGGADDLHVEPALVVGSEDYASFRGHVVGAGDLQLVDQVELRAQDSPQPAIGQIGCPVHQAARSTPSIARPSPQSTGIMMLLTTS